MSAPDEDITGPRLADLWRGAMIFAPHFAGCTCAGGFHVPLDPRALEEDLLDFLAYRYRGEGKTALADFVAARVSDRASDFGRWLETLDAASLGQDERKRLMGDISTTLESMNGARPAKAGYVCY